MKTVSIESEVIRMGDVGVIIDLVDQCIASGTPGQAERAAIILKEVFDARYNGLRQVVYGGEYNA